jgi:hypothetical protein
MRRNKANEGQDQSQGEHSFFGGEAGAIGNHFAGVPPLVNAALRARSTLHGCNERRGGN